MAIYGSDVMRALDITPNFRFALSERETETTEQMIVNYCREAFLLVLRGLAEAQQTTVEGVHISSLPDFFQAVRDDIERFAFLDTQGTRARVEALFSAVEAIAA